MGLTRTAQESSATRTFKRILVGTDFSPAAMNAVKRAALLAVEQRAEVRIVHVTPSLSKAALQRMGLSGFDARLEPKIQVRLARAVRLAEQLGASATTRVFTGHVAQALLLESKRFRADLLIVGEHGRSGLKTSFIGTTAERLIERSQRSVLLVKRPATATYRSALLCIADAPVASAVLTEAASLAGEAQLKVLHSYEPLFELKLRSNEFSADIIAEHRHAARQQAKQVLDRLLREQPLAPARRFRALVRSGFASDVILRSAASARAELVAVGKNRSAVEDFFVGSVTKRVLRSAPSDVLIVVPQE